MNIVNNGISGKFKQFYLGITLDNFYKIANYKRLYTINSK